MNWPLECAAVIPCLNEEAAIGPLVTAVRNYLPTVIVVDDHSRDRTAGVAGEAGAQVLRHERNRGKGAALQTGWRWAHKQGLRWTLTLDGDGQHLPADIPHFFACAESSSAVLVVGNRMGDAARMPVLRRRVNRWMSQRLSAIAGQPLPDSQCGFRLMNLDTWSALSVTAEHFEIESDVLMAFLAARQRVVFTPIRVIYRQERSKIDPVCDTIRWFRWWLRARREAEVAGRSQTSEQVAESQTPKAELQSPGATDGVRG